MNKDKCDWMYCRNDYDITLVMNNCKLCDIHWEEYCDKEKLHIKATSQKVI